MNITTKAKENIEKEHFNKIAKTYEKKYGYSDRFTKYKIDKKTRSFIHLLKNSLENLDSIRILEIGCGTGTYTFKYAGMLPDAKIIASDISEGMIKVAKSNRKLKNLSFEVMSAYDTGLEDSSVDVVCGFYILHHLNFSTAIKEIKRVLKPGGMVYFYEPNILNPVVYLIKSNTYIKKLVGDSSVEWAVNPLTVEKLWKGFEIKEVKTTEFVWPLSFVPYELKIFLDKLTSVLFAAIPGLNLVGGSVEICLKKK